MPEINLELLKKKTKITEKYRPYDDIPEPKRNSDIEIESHIKKIERDIRSQLEKDFQKKLEKSEKELKKSIDNKRDSLPIISCVHQDEQKIYIDNQYIEGKVLYRILKVVSTWSESQRNLFLYVLEKTDSGQLKNVWIGRRELEMVVHSKYLGDAKEGLITLGVLHAIKGKLEKSNRVGVFYSIDLSKFS